MPFESKAQAGAMYAAASGKSSLGIPKSVGQEFVSASAGKPTSPLPEYVQAQQGAKKTHRGRRSKGKGAKAHQAEGKTHIANAAKATTPGTALPHLFAAIRSMHAAKQATAAPSDASPMGSAPGGY